MSSRVLRPLVLAALIGAAIFGMGAGFAGASSIEAMLEGALQPSSAPALLGPITEGGRTGWACKPEQAAAAKTAKDAELPVATDRP
jgi:hypothetical protein